MLLEFEKMCMQKDFDKEKAEQILRAIDVNREFVDSKYECITTPLDWAAMWANYEMVELLLENGADPNLLFDNGTASVLWELQDAENDEEENIIRLNIVKLLLEKGADPHIVVEDEDLYHWVIACWQHDTGIQAEYGSKFIDLLEEYGA